MGATKTGVTTGRIRKGRPPLSRAVARHVRVVTFVTEKEKALLDELAGRRSKSLSAVCFELIAAGLNNELINKQNEEYSGEQNDEE